MAGWLQAAKSTIRRTPRLPPPSNRLHFVEPVPELHLVRRDPRPALDIFRGDPAARPAETGEAQGALARAVAAVGWYHTIELPDGVVTPGAFDHRPLVPDYAIPADLTGKRVLDVNTFDGFWAFEFEKRGAHVVAADLPRFSEVDFPPAVRAQLDAESLDREVGVGFRLAHAALESTVEYFPCSVYDLDPAVLGTFDLVHVGDLLIHLRDPVGALHAVRRMTAGQALIVDCFDPALSGTITRYLGAWDSAMWWLPSLDALGQMVLDAGFADVQLVNVYRFGGVHETDGLWRASLLAST